MAVISHIGKNTDHGHYVCHIKKNGVWALFNDEKVRRIDITFLMVFVCSAYSFIVTCQVAKSKVPLDNGYMYLYHRDS